jgi:sRNA-binding protein
MRVAVVVALCAVAACGPITYVSQVTRGAQNAVDQARAAEADKYSPYYWTRATEYLHASREDVARADFQGANRFGRLAQEAAELATNEAMVAKKEHREAPSLAPAKDTEKAAPVKLAPVKDEP